MLQANTGSQGQNMSKGTLGSKLSGKVQQPSYHQPTSTPYLEASFFSPTEGMD
jgi:hypothetical protein